MDLLGQMKQSTLGRILMVWIGLSLIGAGLYWYMLPAVPLLIISFGAPLGAVVIAVIYTMFVFITSAKLLMERYAPQSSP